MDFAAGQGAVALTNEAPQPNRVAMPDAVKITKWTSGELFDDDADGEIDASDFGGFTNCMNSPDAAPVDSPCANHDADGDEDVDLTDFAQFQLAFDG